MINFKGKELNGITFKGKEINELTYKGKVIRFGVVATHKNIVPITGTDVDASGSFSAQLLVSGDKLGTPQWVQIPENVKITLRLGNGMTPDFGIKDTDGEYMFSKVDTNYTRYQISDWNTAGYPSYVKINKFFDYHNFKYALVDTTSRTYPLEFLPQEHFVLTHTKFPRGKDAHTLTDMGKLSTTEQVAVPNRFYGNLVLEPSLPNYGGFTEYTEKELNDWLDNPASVSGTPISNDFRIKADEYQDDAAANLVIEFINIPSGGRIITGIRLLTKNRLYWKFANESMYVSYAIGSK